MASNSKNIGELLNTDDDLNRTDLDFTSADGTGALDLPNGTTAQRPTATSGMLRYNSTNNLAEYYDGTGWKSIDSSPVVSSISPDNIADSDDDVDITITGSFFASGATVKAIGSDASEISAGTVTFTNSTTLVANFDGTSFDDTLEDYDIEVTNVSGLSGVGNDLLSVNASPVWTVAAGTLATIYDSGRTGVSITTGATDDEGASLTYSVSVGSLPAGLSISSSTGTITGDATAVGSDTTSTFTLSVTDGSNTVTRQYSIIVKAPVITSYTSTGSGTFSVPSGLTSVDVLVVGGGGSGGTEHAGGGGAGGLIYRPAFPVTPGGSVSYTVGSGAASKTHSGAQGPGNGFSGDNGQDSVFGGLTAKGGGGGATYTEAPNTGAPSVRWHVGKNGGSGGGGASAAQSPSNPGGTATQPQQPGDSGTYGFGNPGGTGVASHYGAGGGGAAAAGRPGPQSDGGAASGGNGKQYDISGSQVYYAGGGGGGTASGPDPLGGQGGGGNGSFYNMGTGDLDGTPGQANRGGGGGAAANDVPGYTSTSGAGGSGIVIVKY